MKDIESKHDGSIDKNVSALAAALDDFGMSVEDLFVEMGPEERLMTFINSRAFDRIIEHAADKHLDTHSGYHQGHENELSEAIFQQTIDDLEDAFAVSMLDLPDEDHDKLVDAVYKQTDRMASRIITYMEAGVAIGSPRDEYFPTRTGVANFTAIPDNSDDDDDDEDGETPLIA
jgi:hypothetical protein